MDGNRCSGGSTYCPRMTDSPQIHPSVHLSVLASPLIQEPNSHGVHPLNSKYLQAGAFSSSACVSFIRFRSLPLSRLRRSFVAGLVSTVSCLLALALCFASLACPGTHADGLINLLPLRCISCFLLMLEACEVRCLQY